MLKKLLSVSASGMVIRFAVIAVSVFVSQVLHAETMTAANKKVVVSRMVKTAEGKSYIEVDGKPFLYNAVQSWYPPEKDYSLYVQKTAEANYKCFTFWLYWKHLEPLEGKRDWTELDKVIDLANKYNVRLDIVWAGTNFCGHLDPRFAPDWLLNAHKAYHLRDANDKCVVADGFDMGKCCAADPANAVLLQKEKTLISDMLEHLKSYDTNHRVIAIQIENEANIHKWLGGKGKNLEYIDALGQVVKESNYTMVTRVNLVGKAMDKEIDNLQYIDGHGPDPYDEHISITRAILNSPDNTKFKYIAENAAYGNSTSLIVASLAGGGFYNIYRVDYDSVWNKPGVYDKNFKLWPVTQKIKNLNEGLNKIGALIAQSPKQKMLEFNTETDYPSASYKAAKPLCGINVGFKGRNGSEPVGLVVQDDGAFYCVADDAAYFTVDVQSAQCQAGHFNGSGQWIKDSEKPWARLSDSEYQVEYDAGTCLRISAVKK
jgi:hypothetical protein